MYIMIYYRFLDYLLDNIYIRFACYDVLDIYFQTNTNLEYYEGDPRSNANPSVISFTFGISKNGLHVYNDILSILGLSSGQYLY